MNDIGKLRLFSALKASRCFHTPSTPDPLSPTASEFTAAGIIRRIEYIHGEFTPRIKREILAAETSGLTTSYVLEVLAWRVGRVNGEAVLTNGIGQYHSLPIYWETRDVEYEIREEEDEEYDEDYNYIDPGHVGRTWTERMTAEVLCVGSALEPDSSPTYVNNLAGTLEECSMCYYSYLHSVKLHNQMIVEGSISPWS